MTQWDVFEVIESDKDRWFTTNDIAEITGLPIGGIRNGCKKLFKSKIVKRKRQKDMKSLRHVMAYHYKWRY